MSDTTPDQPKRRKKRTGLKLLGALVLFGAGFGFGTAAGSSSGTASTSAAKPAPTATVTVAAPAVASVPAATVTVPGPETTVTVFPSAAPTQQATADASGITEGLYEVPTDVKPGKYRSPGAVPAADGTTGNCYWSRLKSLDGAYADNIIDNNNSAGPQVVVIKASDKAFQTAGCKPWVKTG